MSDIFISYKREERGKIQTLVEALKERGWSVWWDREIPHGRDHRQVIDKALDTAKCVLVVWSKNSVLSPWVIDEADEGRRQNKLVPILIDDVEIPLGFRQIQTANLIDWKGESSHSEFEKLLKSIAGIFEHFPDLKEAEWLEQARRERERRDKAAREEAESKAHEKELKSKNKINRFPRRVVYGIVIGFIIGLLV